MEPNRIAWALHGSPNHMPCGHEHFADNSTADVPSFILRTDLSDTICLGSMEALMYNDSMISVLTRIAKLQRMVCINDFWLFRRPEKLSWTPFRLLRSSFLHGSNCVHWVAKSCSTTAYLWLFRDAPSSLRTFWSPIVKSPNFFCSMYGISSSPSARSPRNLGSPADFAISVFREMSFNTVLPGCHFRKTLRIWVMRSVCEELQVVSVFCGFLICLHFSVGCNNRRRVSGSLKGFWFCWA